MRDSIDRFINAWGKLLLPFSAFLIPVFFLPVTPDFFNFNKKYLLFILITLALVSWIIRMLFQRRVILTISPATVPLVLLSLIFILSSLIQSPNSYLSLMGKTATIVSLTLLFIVSTTLNRDNSPVLPTFLGLSAAVSLTSLVALLDYFKFTVPNLPANLLSDSLSLLGFLLPLIFPLLYLGLTVKSFGNKFSFLISTALALAASATQISLLFIQKAQTPILLPLNAGWAIAVDIFKNGRSAFLGVGPEDFVSVFSRLRPLGLNIHPIYWNIRFAVSSNEAFQLLTTVGLLGFLFFALAFYRPLKTAVSEKIARSNRTVRALVIGLASYLAVLLIVPANTTLLVVSVILLALLCLELKGRSSDSVYNLALSFFALKVVNHIDTAKEEPLPSGYTIFVWLFSLALTVPTVYFWIYAGRAYAAAIATYQAIQTLNTNARESYDRQIKAYNLEPANPVYRINFAQTSLALANSLAVKTNLSDQDRTTITQLIQQSIRESKNAVQLAPTSAAAWENLANTYKQLLNFADGAPDWAVATYNQAITLDPSNPSLRLNLGGVFYARGDYDNAARLYGQAADLKPDWANAHYNLAAAYKAKKDYPKALVAMEQVMKLIKVDSPDYPTASSEYDSLKAMVPSPTPETTPTTPTGDLELVTPTPIKPSKNQINLPKEAAPDLPATPSATPQ